MNRERPNAAHTPATAGGSFGVEPPSDLELMMFHDGELEEPRRAEVAAYVQADLGARGKLGGLRIASTLVREHADSLAAADDIADLVMNKLSANGAHAVPHVADSPPAPIVAPLPSTGATEAPLPIISVPLRPAANDNRRRVFVALGALVAAAAAVLAVWSRQPVAGPPGTTPQSPVAALSTPQSPVTSRTVPAVPPSGEAEIDAAFVSPDAESDHGVEVAAVNFGAHMGSIFYVPSGSIEAKRTTTVVWLADDDGE